MTNETLVERIRDGVSVTDNMQLLYENNLPLIRQIIKPYARYEPLEDLLLESYFGLWDAVKRYETSENVRFMTYARYWIKQAVRRYIEKCGSAVYMPSHVWHKIFQYKKAVEKLEREQGGTPTDADVAACIGVPAAEVPKIKIYAQGTASLDTPIAEDESITLSDTLEADICVEDETIDKIYAEHSKNELWGIVGRYTGNRENEVIKEIFINNKTMAQIAREQGVGIEQIRQIKEKGLRKLKSGRARRELIEKFEIAGAGILRGGLTGYKEHDFTSIVERTVIKKLDAQERYERHLREIEERYKERLALSGK